MTTTAYEFVSLSHYCQLELVLLLPMYDYTHYFSPYPTRRDRSHQRNQTCGSHAQNPKMSAILFFPSSFTFLNLVTSLLLQP